MRKNAVEAKLEDQTVEGFETVTNPKFEVYTDKSGEFRFRLKARNGEIIAVSEGYKAKASCLNGIESVRKNGPDAPVGGAERPDPRQESGKQCKAVPTLRKQADSVYTEPACFMLVGALPQSPQNTKTVFWNDG